jgi:hypothetical protein
VLLAGGGLLASLFVVYLRRDTTSDFLAARDRVAVVRTTATDVGAASRVDRLACLDADGVLVGRVVVRRPVVQGPDLRTLVVYAGKETGDAILALIPDRPGLAVMAPLYPEIDPKGPLGALAWPAKLRAAVFSTVASGMAALDHLDAEGFERGRTVVLAASLGTAFGTIHTALDPRIDELVIVHGGGDFPKVLRHTSEGRNRPLRAALLPWVGEALVDTYDPIHWVGAVSPRPVLLIATRRDRHFPVDSVEAVYEAAEEPKTLIWTDTDHVGASKTEIVESVMVEIEAYLDRAD